MRVLFVPFSVPPASRHTNTPQERLRDNLVVKGDRKKAVSELEAGRRTIVRDPDDPMQEANVLDSLMVGREDELEDELRAAYAVVRNRRRRRRELACIPQALTR